MSEEKKTIAEISRWIFVHCHTLQEEMAELFQFRNAYGEYQEIRDLERKEGDGE